MSHCISNYKLPLTGSHLVNTASVTFKDYAVCDITNVTNSNVATAKTISDDWESYLLLVPELLRMVAVRISPPAQAMRMRARTAR